MADNMTRFRDEVATLLMRSQPQKILYPIQFMQLYYAEFGRRITSNVGVEQEFSSEALYAWLYLFTSLDISRLVM